MGDTSEVLPRKIGGTVGRQLYVASAGICVK